MKPVFPPPRICIPHIHNESTKVIIDWKYLNQSINNDLSDNEIVMCTCINGVSNYPYTVCMMSNGVFTVVHDQSKHINGLIIGKINLSHGSFITAIMPFYKSSAIYLPSERNDNDLMVRFLFSNLDFFQERICHVIVRLARNIVINSENIKKVFQLIKLSIIQNMLNARKNRHFLN